MLRSRIAGIVSATLVVGAGLASVTLADRTDDAKKLTEAKEVFTTLMNSTDRSVPKELLENAKCVVVIPGVLKAALGVGARHGKGVMACRTANGWSAPSFVNINGGSTGLQIGVEKTDLVLFFMNEGAARSLTSGTKVTLGGKASIAAGPFGRSGEAATNLELKAEIYSYARSKGLFAGLSLEGARLAPDEEDNHEFYGPRVSSKELLFGSPEVTLPAEAQDFLSVLPPR